MINLENYLQAHFYWVVCAQVITTLIMVPTLCYWMAKTQVNQALSSVTSELKNDLQNITKTYLNRVILVSMTTLVISIWLVWNAWSSGSELLSWDNQSGLIILGMIAALPIIFTDITLSRTQAFLRAHGSSSRSAKLTKRHWIELLPKHSIGLIAFLNIAVIAVVIYSFNHPFPGFAGWPNFVGLAVINSIFIANLYYVCEIKRWPAEMTLEKKQQQMRKVAKVIVALWSLAIFYLGITFALSHLGPKTEYIKLMSQSVYFQIMYLIALLFVKSESRTTTNH